MEAPLPRYRREFVSSPHHLLFGVLTLGPGLVSVQPLALIAGATAYVLGWIYLPDLAFFRRWVDRRHRAAAEREERARLHDFTRKRDALLTSLTPARRQRYGELTAVCRGIEGATADHPFVALESHDPRLRKLDELMWTFLRLLSIEESLERFLETERREDLPALVQEAEREIRQLEAQVGTQAHDPASGSTAVRQRLLESRQERLAVLRKRTERVAQARDNLGLVISEQQRLNQQIRLIRADAFATKNATALSARIDATVDHLDQTNQWLSEMDDFKDLVGGMPQTELRVGYESPAPPLLTSVHEKPRRLRGRMSHP